MAAITDACHSGTLEAEVALVISDCPDARILQEARERNLETRILAPGPFKAKLSDEAEQLTINLLREAAVDWVLLAGFMRIIKADFLRAFPERIVNIHPSLLPSFPGLDAPAQALAYGVQVTGTTVHMVDQGIDTGAIIAQEAVRVEPNDTPGSLHDRIKQAEHHLYPRAVADLVSGRIRVEGREVIRTTSGTIQHKTSNTQA